LGADMENTEGPVAAFRGNGAHSEHSLFVLLCPVHYLILGFQLFSCIYSHKNGDIIDLTKLLMQTLFSNCLSVKTCLLSSDE